MDNQQGNNAIPKEKKYSMYTDNNTVYFSAHNIDEFKALIEKAVSLSKELEEALDKLSYFRLEFKIF